MAVGLIRGGTVQLSHVFAVDIKVWDYEHKKCAIEEMLFEDEAQAISHLYSLEPGEVSLVLGEVSLLNRFLTHVASSCARRGKSVLFHSGREKIGLVVDSAEIISSIILEDEYEFPVFKRIEPALRLNSLERAKLERARDEFSNLDFEIDVRLNLGGPDDINYFEGRLFDFFQDRDSKDAICFVSPLNGIDEEGGAKEQKLLDVAIVSFACLAKKFGMPLVIGAYEDLKRHKPYGEYSYLLADRFFTGSTMKLIDEIIRIEKDRAYGNGLFISRVSRKEEMIS